MKRTIALAVLALGATWAFLFLPLAKPRAPANKPSERPQSATPAPAQGPVPHRAQVVPAAPKASTTAAVAARPGAAQASSSANSALPAGGGDVRVLGATPDPTSPAPEVPRSSTQLAKELGQDIEYREPTGELGEGILSPDYKLMEESFIHEARDGPWATQQELRIRNLLLAGGLGERVVLVNCQRSVCRIHLEPHGNDPFGDLLRVPGLAAAIGIDTSTPYSLNNAELIVYASPGPMPAPDSK